MKQTSTLTTLTMSQMINILSSVSSRKITEEMIRADIDAGAPTNSDGTINLVHYAAWLLKEMDSGS